MSSKPKKVPNKLPPTKPRNSNALSAKSRVAGMAPMKSKNAPRGGNKNEQRDLLDEVEEEEEFDYEFENCSCDTCRDGFPYHIDGTVKGVRFIDPYHIVWFITNMGDEYTSVYKPIKGSDYYPEMNHLFKLLGYRLTGDNAREQIEKLLVLA